MKIQDTKKAGNENRLNRAKLLKLKINENEMSYCRIDSKSFLITQFTNILETKKAAPDKPLFQTQ